MERQRNTAGLYNTIGHIRTNSGKYINVHNPNEEDIDIEDIAHALAMQPRFGGHLNKHYSVAQHSIEVMKRVPQEFKLQALLHDASEAYIIDVPTPVKTSIRAYYEIENTIMHCIASKFSFDFPFNEYVKDADKIMLELEWERLVLEDYSSPFDPISMQPYQAKYEFLNHFKELTQ